MIDIRNLTYDEMHSKMRTPREMARRAKYFRELLGVNVGNATFKTENWAELTLFEYLDSDDDDCLYRRLTQAQFKAAMQAACDRNGSNVFRTSQLVSEDGMYANAFSLLGVDVYHVWVHSTYWESYACVGAHFVSFKDLQFSYTN